MSLAYPESLVVHSHLRRRVRHVKQPVRDLFWRDLPEVSAISVFFVGSITQKNCIRGAVPVPPCCGRKSRETASAVLIREIITAGITSVH